MPTPVFEFDLNPNTNAVMQDLAWDPWTWEVFCGQFTGGTISPQRQTAVLTRCAPPDDANQCNEISVLKVMSSFHNDQTVVYAQLDPFGEYIAYRIGGGGYDRFELRTIGDVERGIDRVLHRAGPFPTTKDTAQAAGWADRYTVQGFATVGGRLWRYTGDGTGTNRSDPAALTEYDWKNGGEVARHNEPKDTGYLGPGTLGSPKA